MKGNIKLPDFSNINIINPFTIQLLIVSVIGYVIYVNLKRFGLIPDKQKEEEKKKIAQERKDKLSTTLDYDYYKDIPNVESDSVIKSYAELVHNSWGFFNDDEEQIYSVYRKLNTLASVSKLNDFYFKMYHTSLPDELTSNLGTLEFARLKEIILLKPYK